MKGAKLFILNVVFFFFLFLFLHFYLCECMSGDISIEDSVTMETNMEMDWWFKCYKCSYRYEFELINFMRVQISAYDCVYVTDIMPTVWCGCVCVCMYVCYRHLFFLFISSLKARAHAYYIICFPLFIFGFRNRSVLLPSTDDSEFNDFKIYAKVQRSFRSRTNWDPMSDNKCTITYESKV